ncbi:tetratricopeptide repeat protein [Sphingomonas bacterium]|uniref:tetratricopeptide repeat protein n=1 Tax=Sphingomonas bacterium TaxID=1895847 RepID=UPI001576D89C|nr:cytochrome C biogenesis protein [Sphingomonas bacterium]
MGWLIFGLLAVGLLVLLRLVAGRHRGLSMLVGAVVAIAAAGYEWQGHPSLAGHPAADIAASPPSETVFADERGRWMDRLGVDAQVLDTADAFIRNGDPAYAIGILRGAISRTPKSAMLWMGLGNALVHYADGAVTPPAVYAFEHAAMLSPADPAPEYFLGLAEALSGDLDGATQRWRRLVNDPRRGDAWRPDLAKKLMLLESLRSTGGKSAP